MFVYRKEEIREIDHQAEQHGFSLYTLMENAGRGLFKEIKQILSKKDRIIILSGKGNNGGDGIVLARYLKLHGYDVTLTFPLGEPKSNVAKQHLDYYKKQNFTTSNWSEKRSDNVIIDCLLGIGTTLPLRTDVMKIISWSNQLNVKRIAVDLPTGVVADHGETNGAFQADFTFVLHGAKPSAYLLPSSKFYGQITDVHIGLSHTSQTNLLNHEKVQSTFPIRENDANKGVFGSSLLVAGSDEMPGSALLGSIGAMRSGTGKLNIATSKFAASIIAPTVPEATYLFDGLQQIIDGHIPKKIAAAGIGPGLPNKEKAQAGLTELMKLDLPLVVDAGALIPTNSWKRPHTEAPIILTPHPGEFSQLTGHSIKDIQANRIKLSQQFSMENGVTVVLKGQYTVIAYPDGKTLINPTGNSGLAKGGSGDVLTGMIISMLATHTNWQDAVANAIYIHGLCADYYRDSYSETSMTASDFDRLLPIVLREFECQ